MTTFLKNYSFMDLLKDYNYVPETDHYELSILTNFEKVFDQLSDLVMISATDYDFMDLLKDKGYSASLQNHACYASNDNDISIQVAS